MEDRRTGKQHKWREGPETKGKENLWSLWRIILFYVDFTCIHARIFGCLFIKKYVFSTLYTDKLDKRLLCSLIDKLFGWLSLFTFASLTLSSGFSSYFFTVFISKEKSVHLLLFSAWDAFSFSLCIIVLHSSLDPFSARSSTGFWKSSFIFNLSNLQPKSLSFSREEYEQKKSLFAYIVHTQL